MGQSSQIEGKFSWIVGQDVGDRINLFLRRLYPTKTADRVEADTGVPAANVAKWLGRASLPNCLSLIALTCAYGPDFLAAVMPQPPAWIARARDAQRIAELEAAIEAQRRELEALR